MENERRKCIHPGCRTSLSSWNNGAYCYAHQDQEIEVRGNETEWEDDLGAIANLYGRSGRRIHDHITGKVGGNVIGAFVDGTEIQITDDAWQFQGPVPDKPTTFLQPKGTRRVVVNFISGIQVSVSTNFNSVYNPTATVAVTPGCSGAGIRFTPLNASGLPLVKSSAYPCL